MKRTLVIGALAVAALCVVQATPSFATSTPAPREVSTQEAKGVLGGVIEFGSCRLWCCYPRSCYIWQTGGYVQTADTYKSCGTGLVGCTYEGTQHTCVFTGYTDSTCTTTDGNSYTKLADYCIP